MLVDKGTVKLQNLNTREDLLGLKIHLSGLHMCRRKCVLGIQKFRNSVNICIPICNPENIQNKSMFFLAYDFE